MEDLFEAFLEFPFEFALEFAADIVTTITENYLHNLQNRLGIDFSLFDEVTKLNLFD